MQCRGVRSSWLRHCRAFVDSNVRGKWASVSVRHDRRRDSSSAMAMPAKLRRKPTWRRKHHSARIRKRSYAHPPPHPHTHKHTRTHTHTHRVTLCHTHSVTYEHTHIHTHTTNPLPHKPRMHTTASTPTPGSYWPAKTRAHMHASRVTRPCTNVHTPMHHPHAHAHSQARTLVYTHCKRTLPHTVGVTYRHTHVSQRQGQGRPRTQDPDMTLLLEAKGRGPCRTQGGGCEWTPAPTWQQ
jgi:hypothetical protein